VRDWIVAADDRTGAFEVAALVAEVSGPTLVTVGSPSEGSCVVDIATRPATAEVAAERAAAVEATPSAWSAHKIDSTLRGNWAAELIARHAEGGRRVVVLPAWPALGRTCVGGVVLVDGRPLGSVHEHLPGVAGVSGADELRDWLAGTGAFATCDIVDDAVMHAVAAVLADADVLVAGPAGPIGAVFAARAGGRRLLPAAEIAGPILVVCGSANPVSRRQLAELVARRPDVDILATPPTDGELDARAADELGATARARAAELRPSTIVVIGGDTAAAFLGDDPRMVGGFAAPGMPFSRNGDGRGPLVVTKAGGFGVPDALVRLLQSS
jgi:uncharacterized protein YgbK (DUF1537 family)